MKRIIVLLVILINILLLCNSCYVDTAFPYVEPSHRHVVITRPYDYHVHQVLPPPTRRIQVVPQRRGNIQPMRPQPHGNQHTSIRRR